MNRTIFFAVIACGFAISIAGGNQYFAEEDFLNHARKANATIQEVSDDQITAFTEGTLSGGKKFIHHVCHYKVIFTSENGQRVVSRMVGFKSCLSVGQHLKIDYDTRTPSEGLRQSDGDGMHPGLLAISFGAVLMISGMLDFKNFKKSHSNQTADS